MEKKIKIFVIEDSNLCVESLLGELPSEVHIIRSSDIQHTLRILQHTKHIDLVLVAVCDSEKLEILQLISAVRFGFPGNIIGVSDHCDFQKNKLLQFGCSFVVSRNDIYEHILDLIKSKKNKIEENHEILA